MSPLLPFGQSTSPRRRSARGWLNEVLLAAGIIAITLTLRLIIDHFMKGVVPFGLNFLAVAAAAAFAGWRAGLGVLIACQLASWYLYHPIERSFHFATVADAVSLMLNTSAQLVLLWATSRYASAMQRVAQAEEARAAAAAARVGQLQMALRELDHRTMNNFQLAAAVLRTQAGRDSLPETRAALDAAAQKLHVLAAAHRRLTHDHGDLGTRPLAPLLEEVLAALRSLVADDRIIIASELEPVHLSNGRALHLALMVNELVTNAMKHAFPDGCGRIQVTVRACGAGLVLTVQDDGVGRACPGPSGSGSRLIELLAKSARGELSYAPGPGTTAVLRMATI